MELVCTTSVPVKSIKDWLHDESPICCLSNRNIIAFSSIHPPVSDNREVGDAVYHVYVCDIDKPWDRFHVMSSKECINWLDWDVSGTKLIITNSFGLCQVWAMKDYLLNVWQCTHSVSIDGEDIVSVAWLHEGGKFNFMADNCDCVLYSEKIMRAHFSPTLSHFGGMASSGIAVVVASGLVYIGLLRNNITDVILQSEILGTSRSRVTVASITHDSKGDLVVATTDGCISSAIQCYRITLKSEQSTCSIACKPMASLYPKCHVDAVLRESPTSRVTHLKFMPTECGKILIVAAGDTHTSHVELWHLKEEKLTLHRFYQTVTTLENTPSMQRWVHQSSITHGSLSVSIAVPRFPVVYSAPEPQNELFQYVAISYRDGSIKVINSSTFQPLSTRNLDVGVTESSSMETDGVEKRRVPYLVHMMQTMMGSGLIALDQFGCLYMMRAINTRDTLTKVSVTYLVSMLEYSIMLGYDWWDILASLKPDIIESVIQKLANNFVKQTPASQEVLYARFLAVKSSLYRCSTAGQLRAADCHCQIMLHSLSNAFKSILRPKTLTVHELSPAEKLSNTCSKNFDADIDKVLQTLSIKEYHVETSTLHVLQPLIQWVVDLVLYLLSSLPSLHNYSAEFPGVGLVQDAGVISMLRELLVIIRVWGHLQPACLPHFTMMLTNFDVIASLFKLLTKVWLMRTGGSDGSTKDGEESLIDECCSLQTNVMIPHADQGLFGDMNYDRCVFFQPQPLQYTFGETPTHVLGGNTQTVSSDGQTIPNHQKDIVRQVILGVSPVETVRQCSRCGCMSLLESVSMVPVQRAWDLRWARACPCEGQWKVLENVSRTNRNDALPSL